jgi:hypothetical protein
MFNFPNSPSSGDLFQPVGGPVYQWDGQKWVMSGSPITWTPAYAMRNRICNPAMQHSQENGNTAGTAGPYYVADQWIMGLSTTGTATVQRVQSVTPNGSQNRIRVTATVADTSIAAGEYLQIYTRIEGIRTGDFRWGSASARQVVLRFGFKGPAGTYAVSMTNGNASNRSYLANFTVSAAQANTDTVQTFVIPGDTIGTWTVDNTPSLLIAIVLVAGSTYQGATGWQAGYFLATSAISNFMGTASNVAELFDVGLYLDASGSGQPPAWEMPDEAAELLACMRYYEKSRILALTSANTVSGYFLAAKRVSPTLSTTPDAGSGAVFSALGGPTTQSGFYQSTGNSAITGTTVTGNARM